jgi:hypothetical protein
MQVAIITKTGEQVEIIAVNGGWTTVHTLGADTREMKVRNGALSKHTDISDETRKIYESTWTLAKTTVAATRPVTTRKPIEERLNGVVYAGYLPQYSAYTAVRADGTKKRSIDKGDEVAQTLRTMELHSVYKLVARTLQVSSDSLLERFCHLNPGMQRMNLGNMLRKALREGTNVAA